MVYALGAIRVDATTLTATVQGSALPLGAKVVRALVVLCAHADAVVTREALIAATWPEEAVDDSSLWQAMYVLRKTLSTQRAPNRIENVRGRGYRLTGPVQTVAASPPETAPRRWPVRAALLAFACVLAGVGPPRYQQVALTGESARLLRLARYYYDTQTEPALKRSQDILVQLVRREPASARAYAALADTESALILTWGPSPSARAALVRARAASAAAMRLEPNAADALTAYATVSEIAAQRFGAADESYERAIALDPRYAHAHEQYAVSLLGRGLLNKAIVHFRAAAALDPTTAGINAWLAFAYYLKRQPEAAKPFAAQALYLGDDVDDARARLGLIYAQAHDLRHAIFEFDRLRACCPRLAVAYTAQAYAQSGHARWARALLSRIETRSDAPPFLWLNVAIAQILLDERDAALRSLRHVPQVDPMDRSLLALDPRLDSVRADKRFAPFVRVQ